MDSHPSGRVILFDFNHVPISNMMWRSSAAAVACMIGVLVTCASLSAESQQTALTTEEFVGVAMFAEYSSTSAEAALLCSPTNMTLCVHKWPPPWTHLPLRPEQASHCAREVTKLTQILTSRPESFKKLGVPQLARSTTDLHAMWNDVVHSPSDLLTWHPQSSGWVGDTTCVLHGVRRDLENAASFLAGGHGGSAGELPSSEETVAFADFATELSSTCSLTCDPGTLAYTLARGGQLTVPTTQVSHALQDEFVRRPFVDAVRAAAALQDSAAMADAFRVASALSGGFPLLRLRLSGLEPVRHIGWHSQQMETPPHLSAVPAASPSLFMYPFAEVLGARCTASIGICMGRDWGCVVPSLEYLEAGMVALMMGYLQDNLARSNIPSHALKTKFGVHLTSGRFKVTKSAPPEPFSLNPEEVMTFARCIQEAADEVLTTATDWDLAEVFTSDGGTPIPLADLEHARQRLRHSWLVVRSYGGDVTWEQPTALIKTPMVSRLTSEGLLLSLDLGIDVRTEQTGTTTDISVVTGTLQAIARKTGGEVLTDRCLYGLDALRRGHVAFPVPNTPATSGGVPTSSHSTLPIPGVSMMKVYDKTLARSARGSVHAAASPVEHDWRSLIGTDSANIAIAGDGRVRNVHLALCRAASCYNRGAETGSIVRTEFVVAPTELSGRWANDAWNWMLAHQIVSIVPDLRTYKSASSRICSVAADTVHRAAQGENVDRGDLRHADVVLAILGHVFVTGTGRIRDLRRPEDDQLPFYVDKSIARLCLLQLTGNQHGKHCMGTAQVSGVCLPIATKKSLMRGQHRTSAAGLPRTARFLLIQRHMARGQASQIRQLGPQFTTAILQTVENCILAVVGTSTPSEMRDTVSYLGGSSGCGTPRSRLCGALISVAVAGTTLAQCGGGVVCAGLDVVSSKSRQVFPQSVNNRGTGLQAGALQRPSSKSYVYPTDVVVHPHPGHRTASAEIRRKIIHTSLTGHGSSVGVNALSRTAATRHEVTCGTILHSSLFGFPSAVWSARFTSCFADKAYSIRTQFVSTWTEMAATIIRHSTHVTRYERLRGLEQVYSLQSSLHPVLQAILQRIPVSELTDGLADFLKTLNTQSITLPDESTLFSVASIRDVLSQKHLLTSDQTDTLHEILQCPGVSSRAAHRRQCLTIVTLKTPQTVTHQSGSLLRLSIDSPPRQPFQDMRALRLGSAAAPLRQPAEIPTTGSEVSGDRSWSVDSASFHPLTAAMSTSRRNELRTQVAFSLVNIIGAPGCQRRKVSKWRQEVGLSIPACVQPKPHEVVPAGQIWRSVAIF